MTSRHSSSSRILNSGLFDGLVTFTELEKRISLLPSNKERGDAFEIFAEAYFATQKIAQAQVNLPLFDVPLSRSIMRPSIAVPRPSVSQTASD